ncbi:MAG: hydroxyacid dehydrogenase, partial [Clostridiales bacterium]
MSINEPLSAEVITTYQDVDETKVNALLEKELAAFDRKIVVLDDDPTGVQTVHGVSVFTDWS